MNQIIERYEFENTVLALSSVIFSHWLGLEKTWKLICMSQLMRGDRTAFMASIRKKGIKMEVTLKALSEEEPLLLQVLLEKCSDYLVFQDEEPIKPSAAQDLFNARPDGIEDKDKVILGIFNDHKQLVGVFDLIKRYAGPKTLSLVLMLIDPSSRGQGIGNKAYFLVEEWAISQQFNKVRLGVLFGNEKGLRFWKSMGYIENGEIKPHLSNKFMVLEKNIGFNK